MIFDFPLGNQLLKVEDKAANIYFNPSEDFKNYTSQAVEYSFNLNGAMTKNLNKGISSIQYNVLNLPQTIEIKSPIAEAKKRILTQNGYIENGRYYFYIKDYLGNNRAVLTDQYFAKNVML